jgi:hypothetical protein
MLLEFITNKKKCIIEVWDEPTEEWNFKEPFGEDFYVVVNQWCIDTFGYHARTAYNRFEFKKQADMEWFVLKWG